MSSFIPHKLTESVVMKFFTYNLSERISLACRRHAVSRVHCVLVLVVVVAPVVVAVWF